jgi:hypothetical protein
MRRVVVDSLVSGKHPGGGEVRRSGTEVRVVVGE